VLACIPGRMSAGVAVTGYRTYGRDTRPSCQDIHWQAWDRLSHPPSPERGALAGGRHAAPRSPGCGQDHLSTATLLALVRSSGRRSSAPDFDSRATVSARFLGDTVRLRRRPAVGGFCATLSGSGPGHLLSLSALQDLCYANVWRPGGFLAEMPHRDTSTRPAAASRETPRSWSVGL
jgi:hypothetical protein